MTHNLPYFQKVLRLFSFSILLFLGIQLQAQIVISEFSAANQGDFNSFNDDNDDWIELQNQGNSAVDISGYF